MDKKIDAVLVGIAVVGAIMVGMAMKDWNQIDLKQALSNTEVSTWTELQN